MATQYLVSCTFLFAVPPGDAYLFLISCERPRPSATHTMVLTCGIFSVSSYSLSLVNTAVALGLLLLYTRAYRTWDWSPPFRAPKAVVVLFLVSNLFLILVPFFPPNPDARTYRRLPYWVSACLSRGGCISVPINLYCFSGALSGRVTGVGHWPVVLVCMGHQAPDGAGIYSGARVGHAAGRGVALRIPEGVWNRLEGGRGGLCTNYV